jgi:hypothetical protein
MLKRFLAPALILGVSSLFGLAGCGEESKTETKTEITTPGGTTTEIKTEKVDQTGKNPPPATGETATPPPTEAPK